MTCLNINERKEVYNILKLNDPYLSNLSLEISRDIEINEKNEE